MKVRILSDTSFKSKITPYFERNKGDINVDAWNELTKAANKEFLLPNLNFCIEQFRRDGYDNFLAFEKYTSDFGVKNYYIGLYSSPENLLKDRKAGGTPLNTVTGDCIKFQKDLDEKFKIMEGKIVYDNSDIIGSSLAYSAIKLFKKILDKTSKEHLKIYGFVNKNLPKDEISAFRLKLLI